MTNARHRASHGAHAPVERELAQTQRGDVDAELAARSKNPEGDRELESGSFLAALGWCEIDGDPPKRELEAGVPDGGADALARLLHGGIR
jgi:hypothetical protein